MVKVTENWASTLRGMKVGETVIFPISSISSVNTTISRLRLEMCVGRRDRPEAWRIQGKTFVMNDLSEREHLVAEQYCKGLADKEVADSLGRSTWTIKAQKRDIYRKLGISKDTELVLYMFCEKLKINFDLKEIRKHGLEMFFSFLFILMAVTDYHVDMRRCRMQTRARVTRVVRRRADGD